MVNNMENTVRLKQIHKKETAGMRTFTLVANQQLTVSTGSDASAITILDPQGQVKLAIQVTAEGPRIRLEGSQLTIEVAGGVVIDGEHVSVRGRKGLALNTGGDLDIRAAGNLAIDAKSVAINGREKLAHTSNGDVEIQADGVLHSEARAQEIVADLGNVNIKANDDVTLDGERIRMNC